MRVITCEQGSTEWFAARCGRVTSSRVDDVLAKIKSGEAAGRRNYKAQLVAEILTGEHRDSDFQSRWMKEGKEKEPLARAAYEIATGEMVDQVGFVQHPTIERAGASPDGLVGTDGLIEIKCPKTATHIEYLLRGTVPADYQKQIIWQLACTGRQWCDFVSYDDSLPEHLQLLIVRMVADREVIEHVEDEVRQFLKEVNGMLTQLEAVELVR